MRNSREIASEEFGFGGWVVQTNDAVPRPGVFIPGPPLTLDEDYDKELQALREVFHGREVRTLTKTRSYTQGLPTLTVAAEFRDGISGADWYHREILIHSINDGEAYHLGLICRKSEVPAFLPLFEAMAPTFRVHCKR
ncbi:MAG TPA: hypothetical protein VHM88_15115 [Candidatus Acidoferrales bacterium]|nr:hypothetical protein [Candidatus Acidoferrales bacterium]